MDYDNALSILSLSEILEQSGISEAEVLDILIRNGYIELPDYVRRLCTEESFEETEAYQEQD
jgi:hypothetical protein